MNVIALLLLIVFIGSIWLFPLAASALGITFILFSLAIAISSIFKKHKQAENPRPKIVKDVLILVFTLLLILFLGGLAGMFANFYASPRFGEVTGFVSAIAASFAVGIWSTGEWGKFSGDEWRASLAWKEDTQAL